MLVIDDEPEVGRAVRTGLRGADFTVEWAATGADTARLQVSRLRWCKPPSSSLLLALAAQAALRATASSLG